ncbi:hypothetical protein ACFLY2_00670 [Patescibacteria group bacterium]
MIKKILVTIILIIALPTSLFANNEVGNAAQNWFTTFSKKISIKYSSKKEILYFESFSRKLDELMIRKEFNEPQTNLIKLSNEKIFTLKKSDLENSSKIILNTNKLLNDFNYISYNPNHIFLEN